MVTKHIVLDRGSTFILKTAIIVIGIAVLALCMFALPATWQAVPDEYPFIPNVLYAVLLAMYITAIPFYIALYQALNILSYIDKNKAFSRLSVTALKRISYCGLAISIVYAMSLPLFYVWAKYDDAPGLVIVGMALTCASFAVAVFAGVLQRLLKQAIAMKSENDLTV